MSIDIEEYLKTLNYNPELDGDEGIEEGPGHFKKNYKMTIREEYMETEEEKIDYIEDRTTNIDESMGANQSPIALKSKSDFQKHHVRKLEPVRIDLSSDLTNRLKSMDQSHPSAYLRQGNTLHASSTLSNVRLYTRHNSLIKTKV